MEKIEVILDLAGLRGLVLGDLVRLRVLVLRDFVEVGIEQIGVMRKSLVALLLPLVIHELGLLRNARPTSSRIACGTHLVEHPKHRRKGGLVVVRALRVGREALVDSVHGQHEQGQRSQDGDDPDEAAEASGKESQQLHEAADAGNAQADGRDGAERGQIARNRRAAQQAHARSVVVRHDDDGAVALHHQRTLGAMHAHHVLTACDAGKAQEKVVAEAPEQKQRGADEGDTSANRAGDRSAEAREDDAHEQKRVQDAVGHPARSRRVELLDARIEPMLIHELFQKSCSLKFFLAVRRGDPDAAVEIVDVVTRSGHAVYPLL